MLENDWNYCSHNKAGCAYRNVCIAGFGTEEIIICSGETEDVQKAATVLYIHGALPPKGG